MVLISWPGARQYPSSLPPACPRIGRDDNELATSREPAFAKSFRQIPHSQPISQIALFPVHWFVLHVLLRIVRKQSSPRLQPNFAKLLLRLIDLCVPVMITPVPRFQAGAHRIVEANWMTYFDCTARQRLRPLHADDVGRRSQVKCPCSPKCDRPENASLGGNFVIDENVR